jgi:SulP family sulfate permease
MIGAFAPKSVAALRHYSWSLLRKDLVAGVTVGLVALPLAMAFSIASGLTPQQGIYCAIVTGFVISALGGSNVQIGGPTGAFVVVVAGIVAQYGVSGLYICTAMAGVMLVLMGLTKTGSAVKFIPRPIVVGFTNGIAILIASTQLRDFFGIQVTGNPGAFLDRLALLASHAGTFSVASTLVAAGTIATIVLVNRYVKVVPGMIVALVGGTLAAYWLGLPIDTIGTRFGGVPSGLPHVQFPAFEPALLLKLISPAVTIAMLGAIESLMSAVVADRMTGDGHDPNTELMAQGVANILSPMVGGLPATGAIARTATNVRSGGQTPVAGMVHALTLLIILLVGAPLAGHIPMAVLAGILMVVAANMGEWREIAPLLRHTYTDRAVWAVTLFLTVFADLTVAVEVGMVLAALLFIRRVSATTTVSRVTPDYVDEGRKHVLQNKPIPPDVAIFRIHGPFLFGSTDQLHRVTDDIDDLPPIVVFRLRNMTAIDATGLKALEDAATLLNRSGRTTIFCGAPSQPAEVMARSGFAAHVGAQNLCANVDAALARAEELRAQRGRKIG